MGEKAKYLALQGEAPNMSSIVSLLRGKLQIDLSTCSIEEMVLLIRNILEMCAPYIQYCLYLLPISGGKLYLGRAGDKYNHDPVSICFPEDISVLIVNGPLSPQERCFILAHYRYSRTDDGKELIRYILYTNKGKLVCIDTVNGYKRKKCSFGGVQNIEIIKSWTICDEELA
jgi:hypothetical protein